MKTIVPPNIFAPAGKKAGNCHGCKLFASLEPLKWPDGKVYFLCGNCYGFATKLAKDIIKLHITFSEFRKQCLEYRFAKAKEGIIIKPHFNK